MRIKGTTYNPNPVSTVRYSSFEEEFQSLTEEEVIEMIRDEWEDFKLENQDPDKAASQIIYELEDWIAENKRRKELVLKTLFEEVSNTKYNIKKHEESKKMLGEKLIYSINKLG